jgi:hypothetical protein
MLTKFLFIIGMSQCFKCCCYGFVFLSYVEYLVFVCRYGSILNVRFDDISGWYYFKCLAALLAVWLPFLS